MNGRWLLWLFILSLSGVLAVSFSGTNAGSTLKTPGAEALSPFQNVLQQVTSGAGALVNAVKQAGELSNDNQHLRRELERLQSENVRLQEAGQENQQLRALLSYERDNPGREYKPATIIAYDPNNLLRSVTINRGTESGVQKGMVAVSDVGLAGKVVEAYPRAAKVLLLTDPSSVVNAVVQRSRVQGVVTGRPNGGLGLQYIERDADVRQGDAVVTSGLGGGFPKGYLIGKVAAVTTNDQALFKEIRIEPAVKASALEIVLVVTDFTPVELP